MQATDFTAPESHETVIRQIRTRSEEKANVVGKRCDGSTLMCEIRGCEVQYEGKEVRMVALRDVSDRWEAEQARENLQESELRFRMLFDDAPDAICTLHPQRAIPRAPSMTMCKREVNGAPMILSRTR
jgi:PAS domain-containing protein